MVLDDDPYPSLLAAYQAAVARERAEWKLASDASAGPVERVKAYGRWLAAADRVKALSARLEDDDENPSQPCRL
jgi:hypothetical protein